MIERYRRDDSQGGSFRPFSSFRDERRRSTRSPVMAGTCLVDRLT